MFSGRGSLARLFPRSLPHMNVAFAKLEVPTSGAVVTAVFADNKLAPSAAKLDKQTKGAISRAIAASRFKGRAEDSLLINAPAGTKASRIVLVGLGKKGEFDALGAQSLGDRIYVALGNSGDGHASVLVDDEFRGKISAAEIAASIAFGARLRSYRFDKYRTTEKPDKKPSLKRLSVLVRDLASTRRAYEPLASLGDAVFVVRDLVSEPANIIYPETLAAEAKKLGTFGVKVEVLGEKRMAELHMNALLGVGQGSARESQLVVMQWQGARDRNAQPIAFIGKGVTFDTGGISIK